MKSSHVFSGLVLLSVNPVIAATATLQPAHGYTTPRFTESSAARREKVESVVAEIDKIYRDFATQRHAPGIVHGIVLDDTLVHVAVTGFANVEKQAPVTIETRFRIASMTKSFTAMAILKLRDAGKLSLQDPVTNYIPEFREVRSPTADSPVITLRHLLTMTPGFPEDNPWGDRQLAITPADFRAFVRGGVSMSNTPGVAFEYSNFAYALLGQIIGVVTKEPYQRFITREILGPLGMKDTRWEFSEVPPDHLALGYRWENDAWHVEPLLHDGTYGAMGGLLTTIGDFSRYVAFHLSAWPPRDDRDSGVVRRATLREMHQPAQVTSLVADAKTLAGDPAPFVIGYGYGLRWAMDNNHVVNAGHSGGLPGFGSNYRFYPEHGFAVISFANLTYAGMSALNAKAGAILIEKAKLPRRTLPPSSILETRQRQVAQLVQSWDATLADSIVAENFFLDRSREEWAKRARETLAQAGKITAVGEIVPENQLRGTFPILGEQGRVEVYFTLTPERTPRLQELRLTFLKAP